MLQKEGINIDDISILTAEQLKYIFDELIKICDLQKIITDNQDLPKSELKIANNQTRLSNKQAMTEIFPRTLKKSKSVIENDKQRLEKWLEGFLPHWDIYEMPSTLMRQALIDNDLSGVDLEDLLPVNLWEFIKYFTLIVKQDAADTLGRKLTDFEIFEFSTSHLQSVWNYLPNINDNSIANDGNELTLEIDDLFYKESHSTTINDKEIKKIVTSKTLSEIDKKGILQQMHIDENMSYRHQNEGVIRLLYGVDYCRSVTIDRICMFVGYLAKILENPKQLKMMLGITKNECIMLMHVFIESLLTGANVKKILGYDDPDEGSGGIKPVGLFLQHEYNGSQKQLDMIQTHYYYDVLRKALSSFVLTFSPKTGPVESRVLKC